MTIDEAIQHCEEVVQEKESQGYCDRSLCVIMDVNNATCDECEAVKCRECASEHRQLAEWLKELKRYKENTCDDAISRQAVYSVIRRWLEPDDAERMIWRLEDSVQPQQRTGRWIPVSERLPEEVGTYMTTVDYDKHGIGVGQRYYHGKGLGWEDDCVIAWMPLPEPYKAESEG